MDLYLGIMVFVLGLCVGSFVNMAVWRVGHEKSLFRDKRSFCDFCKKQLKWFDNVPVLSWIAYGGKSRCCGKKLPILYPIVEIMTGIMFLFNYWWLGNNWGLLVVNFFILGLLMFEAAFDFKYLMLPDGTAYALIVLAAVSWLMGGMLVSSLYSALISALFIFILHRVKIRGKEAMGDGDIFLAFFMGLFLGYPGVIVAFYLAFVSGAIISLGLMWSKKISRGSPVPFGPFLIFGTIIAYYWGENIIKIFNF